MRAFIYVRTSSSLRWIRPTNQVNHSIEGNNECSMLLTKLTTPLAALLSSKFQNLTFISQ